MPFILGAPPFEKPSLAKGLTNFATEKQGEKSADEWLKFQELGQLVCRCLANWYLPTPSAFEQKFSESSSIELATYKLNYARWICFCHVGSLFRSSYARFEPSLIFGRHFLRTMFGKQNFFSLELKKYSGLKKFSGIFRETLMGAVAEGDPSNRRLIEDYMDQLATDLNDPKSQIWSTGYSKLPTCVPMEKFNSLTLEKTEADADHSAPFSAPLSGSRPSLTPRGRRMSSRKRSLSSVNSEELGFGRTASGMKSNLLRKDLLAGPMEDKFIKFWTSFHQIIR